MSWSKMPKYRPPTRTEIKKKYKGNIYTIPAGATLQDIITHLDKHWPGQTLDFQNCVFLPPPPGEKTFHDYEILPTDAEFINWDNETHWNTYGNFWQILPSSFNAVNSNRLKDAWPHSLQRRKKFLQNARAYYVDSEIPFEPRFRYDGVKQDWPNQEKKEIYNTFDYITLLKGGAKFYNEHTKGNHLEIIPEDNNYWTIEVPSDKDPQKIYNTIISFIDEKERTLRNFTGSCTCQDHRKKSKRESRNSICKHMIYASAELASHMENPQTYEMLPFPTLNAFNLNQKLDWLLYPSYKTDTSKDTIMRAYIDSHINNINTLFTTNPEYVNNLHSAYKNIVL